MKNILKSKILVFFAIFVSMLYFKNINVFARTVVKDNIEYIVSDHDKTATLSNGKILGGSIEIPSEITIDGEEFRVNAINEDAFTGSDIEGVVIPRSVRVIGKRAFSECKSLSAVGFYESELKIEDYAFYGSGIVNLKLPFGVSYIGSDAFSNCTRLTEVSIPSSLERISSNAFSWCTSLETVDIAYGVKEIQSMSFYHCTKLKFISIPDSVIIGLGDSAFEWCTSLETVNLSSYITEIGIKAFSRCSRLKSIILPENIYYIGDFAFDGCPSLEYIEIPESVTYVGNMAFGNSDEEVQTKLKKVVCVKDSFVDDRNLFYTWSQYGIIYPEFSYKVSEKSASGSIFGEYSVIAYISVGILSIILIFGLVTAFKRKRDV